MLKELRGLPRRPLFSSDGAVREILRHFFYKGRA